MMITAKKETSEQQAVDGKNHQPGLLQVFQLGMFDLAVDPARFSSPDIARKHGRPEPTKRMIEVMMGESGSVKPAQRFFVQGDYARMQRVGRQLDGSAQNRDGAPTMIQNHHHHRSDGDDLQRLLMDLWVCPWYFFHQK